MEKPQLIPIKPLVDSQGVFESILRRSQEGDIREIFVITTNPGCIWGNHYHKLTLEYYAIISGKASIALKNVLTGDLDILELSAGDSRVLKVPPETAHALKNVTGSQLITLVISTRECSDRASDTYKSEIFL